MARQLEVRGHEVDVVPESALTGNFGRPSGIAVSRSGDGVRLEPGVDPIRTASAFVLQDAARRSFAVS